jgi:UDP-N-acetylmuramoyl-tripeptide--D-alanyl-D-alanine ligase
MIGTTLAEVAAVTGGRLHRATGDERVDHVEFDSRAVGPGGLFLALPGERVDGHDFAAAAVAAGAAGVLAAREVDAPAVVVPPAAATAAAAGT